MILNSLPLPDLMLMIVSCVALLTGGLIVLLSKRMMIGAFGLLIALVAIATLYLFLNFDFAAATQIMVYAGGILLLIIFGIMLTRPADPAALQKRRIKIFWPAFFMIIPSAVFFAIFVQIHSLRDFSNLSTRNLDDKTLAETGMLIVSKYMPVFEFFGLALLVILIGALVVAGRSVVGKSQKN